MPPPKPHLMGSLPVPTNTDAFTIVSKHLGSKLSRLPDGETGHRWNWIEFQFHKMPARVKKGLIEPALSEAQTSPEPPLSPDEFPETTYDDAAIESYTVFKQLREQGIIKQGTKFQVGIPTLVNLIRPVVQTRYCLAVEPFIEKRLVSALRKIQDSIPHADLCIQFESAQEVVQLEHSRLHEPLKSAFTPYLDNLQDDFVERLKRLASNIDQDVELGFHLCYGDYMHMHFVEPVDTAILTGYMNAIDQGVSPIHPIAYFHIPVPKERDDEAYFVPLTNLKFKGELYLGVVRENDEEGSRRRLETARNVLSNREFGISTECGLGRVDAGLLEGTLEIINRLCT